MKCPKCNRENEESAMYCRYCGSSMFPKTNKESDSSGILILIWIVAIGVVSFAEYLYPKFIDDWYEGTNRIIYSAMAIAHNLIMLIPVFAIKNKTFKIIGVILMSISVLWWVVSNVMFAIEG